MYVSQPSSVVDCVVAMIEVEVGVVVGVGEVTLPVVVSDVGEGVDEGGKVESKVVVDSHLNEQGQILGIGSAAWIPLSLEKSKAASERRHQKKNMKGKTEMW